jgi:predicted outer membrane protein
MWTHLTSILILGLAFAWMSSVDTAVVLGASPIAAQQDEPVDTRYGPLGSADRDLLVRVRLAGLWQGPAGRQAQDRASSATVKEAARQIRAELVKFDERVRSVAAELNVSLPNRPTAEQLALLETLTAAPADGYDRAFVQLLRDAQGADVKIIGDVRGHPQQPHPVVCRRSQCDGRSECRPPRRHRAGQRSVVTADGRTAGRCAAAGATRSRHGCDHLGRGRGRRGRRPGHHGPRASASVIRRGAETGRVRTPWPPRLPVAW